ncbi:MAG: response regulator transcription factor [Methyloceanibacter sp.]
MQKVLVVSIIDDDESVRAATQCLVRSLGLKTRTFASAEEFLLSPYVTETSCVIADVQMAKMSGLELQSRLRACGNDLPMIFITAFPDERLKLRALEDGAVCFLSKPFHGQVLIDCLSKALTPAGTE